jgi:hypothetical protein
MDTEIRPSSQFHLATYETWIQQNIWSAAQELGQATLRLAQSTLHSEMKDFVEALEVVRARTQNSQTWELATTASITWGTCAMFLNKIPHPTRQLRVGTNFGRALMNLHDYNPG